MTALSSAGAVASALMSVMKWPYSARVHTSVLTCDSKKEDEEGYSPADDDNTLEVSVELVVYGNAFIADRMLNGTAWQDFMCRYVRQRAFGDWSNMNTEVNLRATWGGPDRPPAKKLGVQYVR